MCQYNPKTAEEEGALVVQVLLLQSVKGRNKSFDAVIFHDTVQ